MEHDDVRAVANARSHCSQHKEKSLSADTGSYIPVWVGNRMRGDLAL